jgi:hypothetical protein
MPNTTAPKSKNVTQSANELMDTAGGTFKEIDKTIRKHLDERPYVVLGVVFAVGWLYAKIR